ncbi:cytochrome c oxidase subunit I [Noviherbaspirillum sp. CPCC 100848]|uniref:cytochrome-c oxidase n=1 Tax=Noviherbaspirillum album TaxID=3080276 RepID=A0ABU6JJA0_9BURK|nr:cytochrome c oxidase subunit I [Noviherbaspirillum sp. CPCC 100848]MEC4723119.1 cytochrome c oxidase subunit I [Noviherbaspirillum sp. CPCC 100848]
MMDAAPTSYEQKNLRTQLERIWGNPPGLGALRVVNHTTLGLRFIATGFMFFLIGGILAMLIRSQLAFPGNDLLDHRAYAQAFTMHGTTMMFFFAVPIMEGFAAYLIPKMIGARDLIYPRLSAFGYWCYLFGGILLFSSVFVGAVPDGGWFMYVPLSGREFSPGLNTDFWLLGVTFAEISAVAAGIELIVSILKTRAPGMALHRMPIYAWYILITAFMIVFGFPPLILGSILLELERAFGLPFYDVARGGDPLLWQHLFWIFGHPEVYIIFLPAAGLVTTMLPTFARRPIAGYAWVVLAVIATGFISFGLWVHHMFTVGIPLLSLAFFSAASMAVAIPTGIQVFSWLATLWGGRPVMRTPMLFILGFLFIFVLGGLTGVMVAMVPFDWQVHDTHFIVAHMHYVLFGGMVFPLFAALYYWLPLFSGKAPSEKLSRVVFWTIFLGFNLTFLPMHVTGLMGMPRRVYTYMPGLGWETLNLISTVGGFLSAAGVAMFVIDFLLHFYQGKQAPPNMWNASTLEWAARTPVPAYTFASQPRVTGRDPLWTTPGLGESMDAGAGYLGRTDVSHREMLVTSTVKAEPEYVVILPGNTITPLVTALLTSLFFFGFLVKMYWLATLGAVLAVTSLLCWAWQDSAHHAATHIDAGNGAKLPTQALVSESPGWWGTLIALFADGTLFLSLVFAYFYLWTVAPAWPPAGVAGTGSLVGPGAAMACLIASSLFIHLGSSANMRGRPRLMQWFHFAAIASASSFVALETFSLADIMPATAHAYSAVVHTIVGFQFIHVAIAILLVCFTIARSHLGHVDARRPAVVRIASLFWHYTVLQWMTGFTVIHLFPLMAGG